LALGLSVALHSAQAFSYDMDEVVALLKAAGADENIT
jgi:hypothetical protein